jgi:ketosteroid isomerase-like protein
LSESYFASPEEAEKAFYLAFQSGDPSAMMRVWADDDTIVCVHPMWPRITGRVDVEVSWREILIDGPPMRFEILAAHCTQSPDLAVHCVHESIAHGPHLEQESLVLATNVYRRTEMGWRMIVHHASPGNQPEPEEIFQTSGTLH